MKKRADAVIIGGGVHGCALAYNLARKGKDVVLVEKEYLASGGTGRCGGGIRASFSSEDDIRLMMESIELWKGLKDELGVETGFRQGGYLYLLCNEKELGDYTRFCQIQRRVGLDTEIVGPHEVKKIIPLIDIEAAEVIGGLWSPNDGWANPFTSTYGYARSAEKMGAKIYTYTKATDIRVRNEKVVSVVTSRGEIETDYVVDVAGAESKEIAKLVGLELPLKTKKVEALISDPLERFFDAFVLGTHPRYEIGVGDGVVQTSHGNLFLAVEPPKAYHPNTSNAEIEYLRHAAIYLCRTMPALKYINIIRHWCGLYNLSPDLRPIIGEVDEIEGFILGCGWSGHGYMFGPIVSKLLSELIVEGTPSISLQPWSLGEMKERLRKPTESMVFGVGEERRRAEKKSSAREKGTGMPPAS